MGPSPVGMYVNQDAKAPDQYIPYVVQAGLGLPDRDYYLDEKNPKFAEVRTRYVEHVAKMLELAGVPAAQTSAKAKAILALESKIAKAHWTRVDSRDDDKTYNKWKRADFAKKAPGFDWNAFLVAAGVGAQPEFIVAQPSAIAGTAKLTSSVPLATWKDYLTLHATQGLAPYLSRAFVDADFAFNGTVLSGQPADRGALEARRGSGERSARRGRGQALRGEALPAGGQGRGGSPGEERDRRDGPAPRRAALDGRGDPGQGAREARHLHAEDRLPGEVARLRRPGGQARGSGGQRRARRRFRVRPQPREAGPAGGSRRVVHAADDGQRLREPDDERDRLPGGHPPAPVLRSARGSRGELRRHRRGDRPRDLATTSTTRAASTTPRGASPTGGRRRT